MKKIRTLLSASYIQPKTKMIDHSGHCFHATEQIIESLFEWVRELMSYENTYVL